MAVKSPYHAHVNIALQKAIEKQGRVSRPKGLGVYGASYLYPMFQRFGLLRPEEKVLSRVRKFALSLEQLTRDEKEETLLEEIPKQ